MKYRVFQTTRFRKSLKKMLARGKDGAKLEAVVAKLANGIPLPPQNKDHALSGDLVGLRDCHIESDWILLYFYNHSGDLILTLTDTGTHSDLL